MIRHVLLPKRRGRFPKHQLRRLERKHCMNRGRPRGITLANCQKTRARQGNYKTGAAAITTVFTTTPKKKPPSLAVHEVRQWLAAHKFPQQVVFVVFK